MDTIAIDIHPDGIASPLVNSLVSDLEESLQSSFWESEGIAPPAPQWAKMPHAAQWAENTDGGQWPNITHADTVGTYIYEQVGADPTEYSPQQPPSSQFCFRIDIDSPLPEPFQSWVDSVVEEMTEIPPGRV